MTWAKKDDQWLRHPKVRRAGLHGRALWDAALVECAARNTDGIVEYLVVKDCCYLAECDEDIAVAALVASELWHDAKTIRKCDRCKQACGGKLPADAFFIHDWFDYQPSKDEAKLPQHTLRARRNKALLRDRAKCERIVERDRSMCRYCATRVDFADRKTATGGTYDHVDPAGDNDDENVVVACRGCNGYKRDRTPTEAGMLLLPVPAKPNLALVEPESDPDLTPARSGSDPDQKPAESESDTRAPHAQDRTRPGRAGSGSDRNLTPVRSGPETGAGHGQGQAAPGTTEHVTEETP